MSEKYYTVLEYAQLKGIDLDVTSACSHGRILTKMSKADGKPPVPVKDVDFGSINSYPESILDLYTQAGKLVKRMTEMPFGCHKGVPIDQVDPQYLKWFVENIDGNVKLIETIKQYLQSPEVAAQAEAMEAAREQRIAKAEAKAEAIASARQFRTFNEAAVADMRSKTTWSEMGYKLQPDQLPQGKIAGTFLYHKSQVDMKASMKKEEEERLKALDVLDSIRNMDFVSEIEESIKGGT